ncbi:SAM-dependent methyltransferase [Schizosaccharomyces japonicus yFS275]|uniref:SAM-dependent methyltransferase n=1 Tax=Schizosaccharomyces japonicus (strain yFS275 / FY16936) TaxID=402676 RepID=B6K3Y5_SCHJY|nr:SAM-dependent methyltransferase [Schizosaccharomyces japonicus yFS275]EEB08192.1 SAM-dependent methyltransferase [Schizosaccharomyces japonicus yFS275]
MRQVRWPTSVSIVRVFLRRFAHKTGSKGEASLKKLTTKSEREYSALIRQIQRKYNIFKPNQLVLDLGCAPGYWNRYAASHVKPFGRVIGLDVVPCHVDRNSSFLQGSFLSSGVQHELIRMAVRAQQLRDVKQVGSSKDYATILTELQHSEDMYTKLSYSDVQVDVVLSDLMAPLPRNAPFEPRFVRNAYKTMLLSKQLAVDSCKDSILLAHAALVLCFRSLKQSGIFVCKVLRGDETFAFRDNLLLTFETVHQVSCFRDPQARSQTVFICFGKREELPIGLINT